MPAFARPLGASAARALPAGCRPTRRVQPYGTNDCGGFRNILPPGENGFDNPAAAAPPSRQTNCAARRPTATTSSRCTATWSTRRRGLNAGRHPEVLQGRELRRQARRRRAHLQPALRRHDRARQGLRRAAHLRRHPRRHDVRRSATPPPRTGCSSSTCCGTSAARSSPRSPAARRATRRSTSSSGRSRPTPRPTCSASSTRLDAALRRRGRAAPGRRRRLRRRHQRIHRRGEAQPDQDAGRVRGDRPAAGPDDLKPDRPDRHRRRWSAAIFGKGGGGELGSALVLEAARRRFGKRGPKVWHDFRSAEDPEAPTTVHNGKRVPLRARRRRRAAAASALPDPGTLRSTLGHRISPPRLERRPGGARPGAAAAASAGASRARSRTRWWSRPRSRSPATRWRCSARRSPTSRPRS